MDIEQTQAKLALSASHGVSAAQDALDAINVLVNDAEQMRIRMGEMAAEIDRLNGEREPFNLIHLRALRLWHWKQYLATNGFVKTNEWTKQGIATRHITAVQALNDLFPIGDTAEMDAAKLGGVCND